jgi:hypothetical protein
MDGAAGMGVELFEPFGRAEELQQRVLLLFRVVQRDHGHQRVEALRACCLELVELGDIRGAQEVKDRVERACFEHGVRGRESALSTSACVGCEHRCAL